MATLDEETQKQLTDAEEVAGLLKSRGWGVVHPKFVSRVMDMQNLKNLDLTKPETLNIQVAARLMAAEEMLAWYEKDVVGLVEQAAANGLIQEQEAEAYVDRG